MRRIFSTIATNGVRALALLALSATAALVWEAGSARAQGAAPGLVGPEGAIAGDMNGNGLDNVIIDLGARGLWVRASDATWVKLHDLSPEDMITGDMDGNGQDDVIIDFKPHGLWVRMNDATWVKLHDLSPAAMIAADMDGNGRDEVIFDFGVHGIIVRPVARASAPGGLARWRQARSGIGRWR